MANTPILNLPLWIAGQVQPDQTVRDAMAILDVLVAGGVKSRTTTAQPGTPSEGDKYIIPAGATGAAWSTFAQDSIAAFLGGVWLEFVPVGRVRTWIDDESSKLWGWDGTAWVNVLSSAGFPQNKNDATVDPTVNNDSTEGYSVLSRWANITDDKEFVCLDASVGAAVWIETTQSGGPGGGGGFTLVFKTEAYTAVDLDDVWCDSTSAAFTVTLPATPSSGNRVIVRDAKGVAGTNNITVDRNGSTINGAAANYTIKLDWAAVQFAFDGTTWQISPVRSAIGKRSVWIPVSELHSTGTQQPGALTIIGDTSAGTTTMPARPFDPTSNEIIMGTWAVPKGMDLSQALSFALYWAPTTTNTGATRWRMIAAALNDGSALVATGEQVAIFTDAANGTVNDLHITSEVAMAGTLTGVAAGSLVALRLNRDANDAADTYTGDANLIGIMLHYWTSEPTDD